MRTFTAHSIMPVELAKILAQMYEPDLDWDNPSDYDLLDRTELTDVAERVLKALHWNGYVVESLDDLALDEFE